MSANGIGALERGYRRTPQRETLLLLARALSLNEEQRRAFEAAAAQSAPRRQGLASIVAGSWPSGGSALLPLALTTFVGREGELAEIAALIGEHRLVTLTGPGGIGKTQTALRVGSAPCDADRSVCFVGLASANSLASTYAAIAATVGVREAPTLSLHESLVANLKDRELLLILDNCEHVIAQAATAAERLLAGCPRIRILATSREPLRAAGERTYLLPSLNFPSPELSDRLDATEAADYGAIALFSDRACAVDHRFLLTNQNAPIVAEICRRLDGIPLAIELAAARVTVLSPRQLAQKLDETFRVLTGGDRTALPRHQTMRALIDWSYDLLSEQEQALFRRLSIFAGGFTLETAGAVFCDEHIDEIALLDLLSSLVAKSLVQTDPTGEARYRLLESTGQYAREKLVAAGERDAAVRAHAVAFAELAEELERVYDSTPDREWFARAEPELANLRAALQWALEARGDVSIGQRLAGASRQVWVLVAAEGRRWASAALDSVDASTPEPVVARLELSAALFESALVQHKACSASAQRALEHYRHLGDARGVAFAQRYQGRALIFLGQVAAGEAVLREALAAFRNLGARKMVGSVLEDRGLALQLSGDLAGARALFAEGLAVFKESGGERGAANVAMNLAELEFRSGDAAKALELAGEALAVDRASHFTLKIAHDLSNMAAYFIASARFDEARSHAREALVLARGGYVGVLVAWSMQHLAAVAALRPAGSAGGALEDRARAARLLGYVDAQLTALEATLEYTEQHEYDAIRVALREQLDPAQLDKFTGEGGAWTEDQAVSEALLV